MILFSTAGAAHVHPGSKDVHRRLDVCAHAVHTRAADDVRAADKVLGHHGPGQDLYPASMWKH